MQKIIAANWKMHKTRREAGQCAAEIALGLGTGAPRDRQGVIFAPYTDIATVAEAIETCPALAAGAQNFYPAPAGAYTGEISTGMIADAGGSWLLTGHSERRHIFHEDDSLVAEKTRYGLANAFHVMLCVGETLQQREAGELEKVLQTQLGSALAALPPELRPGLPEFFSIAYEPIWAIGTGKVAGPEEAASAHAIVRNVLQANLGAEIAARVPILYGGSVKPDNAATLLALDNVDGLLIGGASLEAASYLQIFNA